MQVFIHKGLIMIKIQKKYIRVLLLSMISMTPSVFADNQEANSIIENIEKMSVTEALIITHKKQALNKQADEIVAIRNKQTQAELLLHSEKNKLAVWQKEKEELQAQIDQEKARMHATYYDKSMNAALAHERDAMEKERLEYNDLVARSEEKFAELKNQQDVIISLEQENLQLADRANRLTEIPSDDYGYRARELYKFAQGENNQKLDALLSISDAQEICKANELMSRELDDQACEFFNNRVCAKPWYKNCAMELGSAALGIFSVGCAVYKGIL